MELDWLLVGALGVETAPVLRRLEAPRPLSARLVAGRLAGRAVGVLTCGVGPLKAERRTRDALALCAPARVVSFGTCGALVEGLGVGAVVTAGPLLWQHQTVAVLAPLGQAGAVGVVTVAEAVTDAERRAALAASGGGVCEMEAYGVRRAAPERPFGVLKVVSDLAGGDPDDPALPGGPSAVLRFKARAAALVERRLVAALVEGIATR